MILRLQLAGARLALGDPRGARIILHEIDDVLHHRPRLGLLNDQVDALRQQLSAAGPGARTTTLSTALAAKTLLDMGCENVANLDSGITAWIEAGLPTVEHHAEL